MSSRPRWPAARSAGCSTRTSHRTRMIT